MTILPHPHGELLYVAPLGLYEGDEVSFTADPEPGYALKSIVWYTTDAANATDITAAKKFTMPDADVTVKVEFAEIVAATVGGKVTEGGANVPDAAVKLYLGTVEIAATVTDTDGNYSFYNVEKGTYNIVVTKGDKVKTVLVTVDSTGSFSVDVALPVSAVSSVVEVSEDAASVEAKTEVSQIVVGGLDAIAEAETPAPGDKVTIKLTVEPKADANTQEQQAIKREAGNGKKVEFLDLSLWKQVNNDAAQPIGDTNTQLLTIVIPFDFTGVDVSSVMILRHHKGETEKLTESANGDGEYVEINKTAGTIILHVMKFSDYAIAYDTISDEDECVRTETVKLTENGTYGLKLGGRDAGKFTFEKNGSGWNIHNGKKYLAMQGGKLALSDTAFAWTYKNGAFSTSVKTTQKSSGYWFGFIYIPGRGSKTVTTNYYLSTVTAGAKLSTNSVKAELYVEASGKHDFGAWTDCKDGANHKRVCQNCGEVETEAHEYNETTHECVCGAYDPEESSVTISVDVKEKTSKQFSGFLFWGTWKNVTTYTATIKTEATGTKVTKVQYQLNGGRWTTGTSISSDKPINSLKVKVTDSNGKVYDYTYGN